MIYANLKRHEMQRAAEDDLVRIAQTMIPDSPGANDLKAARRYFPSFFGGLFPHLGLAVERTEGDSRYADKPQRPGVLVGRIVVYHPSLPVRGAATMQDDRTGEAKDLTRAVRGELLERIFADGKLGPYFRVAGTREGDRDDVGNSLVEGRGRSILWTDRTTFELHV